MQWENMKNAVVSIVLTVGLVGAGITAMILSVYHPDIEWLKELAFFLFGTGTGPLHDIKTMVKGKETNMKDTAKKLGIGFVIGTALALMGCSQIGLTHPETTVEMVEDNGQICVEVKTTVCTEGDWMDGLDLTGDYCSLPIE